MSGHSKWSTIKHKKAANDAKKGKVFSKLSTQITHAAKLGGGDPEMNPNLRLYIDKAKEAGFPIDRIEKAISKGTGEGADGITYDEMSYEGYGPNGVQIIVDCLTDNKNRTVSELRKIFEEIGGSMGTEGSVSWNFDTKGLILVKFGHMQKSEKFGQEDIFVSDDKDDVMMNVMDIEGVIDIYDTDDVLEVYTNYQDLAKVRDSISKIGYVLDEAKIVKEAKLYKSLTEKEVEKVNDAIERIEDNDDVQDVWVDVEL